MPQTSARVTECCTPPQGRYEANLCGGGLHICHVLLNQDADFPVFPGLVDKLRLQTGLLLSEGLLEVALDPRVVPLANIYNREDQLEQCHSEHWLLQGLFEQIRPYLKVNAGPYKVAPPQSRLGVLHVFVKHGILRGVRHRIHPRQEFPDCS